MKMRAYGLTDVGRVREANQDRLLVNPTVGLFAVADGMGGHAAGEVASRLAIEALGESLGADGSSPPSAAEEARQRLEEAFKEGNRKIYDSVASRGEWRGMGTTIVASLSAGDEVVIGHVGDSRAYLLRDGTLQRLTSDHSWVNEQVRLGLMTDDEAYRHPMRNIVTRALGNRVELQVELTQEDVQPGDLFLLCSDGLNTMLRDDEIRDALTANLGDPETACRTLVDSANQRGGEDNVTVVIFAPEAEEDSAN